MNDPRMERFIEHVGRLAEGAGLPLIAGRVLGVLLITARPLDAAEIAERLKISQASAAAIGRLLESVDLIRRGDTLGKQSTEWRVQSDSCSSLLILWIRRMRNTQKAARTISNAATPAMVDPRYLARIERFCGCAILEAERVLSSWERDIPYSTGRRSQRPGTPATAANSEVIDQCAAAPPRRSGRQGRSDGYVFERPTAVEHSGSPCSIFDSRRGARHTRLAAAAVSASGRTLPAGVRARRCRTRR
jgi:hypothetical protein